MSVNVRFISVWNGGFEVESDAMWDEKTGEVFNIQSSGVEVDDEGDELEVLDGQFIETVDGERLAVIEDQDFPYQVER